MSKHSIKFKNDSYRKDRGGHSRLLKITCAKCAKELFYYQKDGPGILKRVYLDRIFTFKQEGEGIKHGKLLNCPSCGENLGVKIVYEKEKRLAYRLFVGSVSKKIVK